MMWKTSALVVCLLLAGVKALDAGPSYGVKLCGREFIRAVIFTCGGSRWKRSLTNTDEILDLFNSYDSNAADGSVLFGSASSSSQHATDSNLPPLGQGEQDGSVFSRPARSLISEEVLEALRSVDRKGRDVVVGLSNACCKWGCSKGEISSLC
ncbi:relaxin-3a precursor [Danio rerio]|uniref:Relaxin-3 n=1 Tax=Danio rerio TaxID=7955 RepID=Q2VT45_DANRE|nr:relaxin-3a precursor [Danio rerio]AAX39710.1 relaxin 3a [Danio rerio]ACA13585.1 relaxin family locus C type 2 [Danio rerio]|eukprot:NP_001032892.1 relaxin 3a precursor [Danio rerio]